MAADPFGPPAYEQRHPCAASTAPGAWVLAPPVPISTNRRSTSPRAAPVVTPPRQPAGLQPSCSGPAPAAGSGASSQWDALLLVAGACRASSTAAPPPRARRRLQQPATAAAKPSAAWPAASLTATPGAANGFSVYQKRPREEEPQARLSALRVLRRRAAEHCSSLERQASGTPPVCTPILSAMLPSNQSAAALHGAGAAEMAGDARLLRTLSSLLLPAAPLPQQAPRRPAHPASPTAACCSAAGSPRSLSSDPSHMALIASRVKQLLAGLPGHERRELASAQAFLAQF